MKKLTSAALGVWLAGTSAVGGFEVEMGAFARARYRLDELQMMQEFGLVRVRRNPFRVFVTHGEIEGKESFQGTNCVSIGEVYRVWRRYKDDWGDKSYQNEVIYITGANGSGTKFIYNVGKIIRLDINGEERSKVFGGNKKGFVIEMLKDRTNIKLGRVGYLVPYDSSRFEFLPDEEEREFLKSLKGK